MSDSLCDPLDCSMPDSSGLHYLPVCSNSCPLSWWCYLIISSSVTPSPFAFNLSQHQGLFQWVDCASDGQSLGTSATILPMNIQGWFPLVLTGLISLQSKRLSELFSSTTVWKHQFFSTQLSLLQLSHRYKTTGKTIPLTIRTFVSKVMSLIFNMLSRFILAFLQRSKHLLIS